MKFTVDTKTKTLTLLEKISFKDLNNIKKFIGEDWLQWSLVAEQITVKEKEYIYNHWGYWYNRPYYYGTSLPLCGTAGINIGTGLLGNSTAQSNVQLNASASTNIVHCLKNSDGQMMFDTGEIVNVSLTSLIEN